MCLYSGMTRFDDDDTHSQMKKLNSNVSEQVTGKMHPLRGKLGSYEVIV